MKLIQYTACDMRNDRPVDDISILSEGIQAMPHATEAGKALKGLTVCFTTE